MPPARYLAWAYPLLFVGLHTASADDSQITVRMNSGRLFTGAVDQRTDPARLWLRITAGPLVIVRPLDWNSIASAQRGGQMIDLAVLRAEAPAPIRSWADEQRDRVTSSPPTSTLDGAGLAAPDPREAPQIVGSLQIDVCAANWDADVEVDGLIVQVSPIAHDGLLTAVGGTLNVELVGQQMGAVWDRQSFPNLGRWTRSVCVEDFGPAGASYKLPFQAVNPEFDLDVSSIGMVHARLAVPGQGVFDASQASVRIRPYSSVRDRMQQRQGTRSLPQERTGRGA
jgi:hypothetical protein